MKKTFADKINGCISRQLLTGKTVCVYHYVDFDGICSAKIVQKAIPNCDFLGWNYNQRIPYDLRNYKNIIMVDISLPPDTMNDLMKSKNIIWIDHHITAMKDAIDNDYDSLDGIRDVNYAGCVLTWKYFFPSKKLPMGVKLLGDYDIWNKQDLNYWNKFILPYQFGLRQLAFDIDELDWSYLKDHSDIQEIIERGLLIIDYQNKQYDRLQYLANEIVFDDVRFISMNHPMSTSMVLEGVFDPKKHDAMMVYRYNGKKQKWNISLYTTKEKDVNLANIASKYNGGGHEKACGFEVDTDFMIKRGIIT
jgi:oligoribonuclease NrnB/cAMP/cGMP phosphodiesterase (DHH superfamily)